MPVHVDDGVPLWTVQPAAPGDGPAILQLLSVSQLPLEGLLEHLKTALVARRDGSIVGCVALEIYADGALLRSLAVDPAAQARGLGTRLTNAALQLAGRLGVTAVYLLTTT